MTPHGSSHNTAVIIEYFISIFIIITIYLLIVNRIVFWVFIIYSEYYNLEMLIYLPKVIKTVKS